MSGLQLSPATQRATKALNEASAKLTARSFRPEMLATIHCEDGSMFLVDSAFLETWTDPESEDKWIFLFAEHYPSMCFPEEDVIGRANYDRTPLS